LASVTRVTDANGRVLYEAPAKRERVISQDITDQVSWDLSGVIANGTGTGANFGQPAAGKTGTTTEHRDAWFVGYTCKLTGAVWNGYLDNSKMDNVRGKGAVFGGTYAAPIWGKFMAKATQGMDSCPFNRPDTVSGRVGNLGTTPASSPRSGGGTTSTTGGSGPTTTAPPDQSTTTTKVAPTTTEAPPPSTTTTRPP